MSRGASGRCLPSTDPTPMVSALAAAVSYCTSRLEPGCGDSGGGGGDDGGGGKGRGCWIECSTGCYARVQMVEGRVSRQCLLSRKCLRFGVTPEWTSWPSGYFCPGLARLILGLCLLYVLCNVQAALCRVLGHVYTNVWVVLMVFGPVLLERYARRTSHGSQPTRARHMSFYNQNVLRFQHRFHRGASGSFMYICSYLTKWYEDIPTSETIHSSSQVCRHNTASASHPSAHLRTHFFWHRHTHRLEG